MNEQRSASLSRAAPLCKLDKRRHVVTALSTPQSMPVAMFAVTVVSMGDPLTYLYRFSRLPGSS